MPNGKGIIETVQGLLDKEENIPDKTALKLTLGLMLEVHTTITDKVIPRLDAVDCNLIAQKARLELMERKSIVLWVEKHPKLAVFTISFIVITGTVIDLRVLIAKALGIEL